MASVHKCVVSLHVHSMYVCTVYAHTCTHVMSMRTYNVHACYVYVVVCVVCACTYEHVSQCAHVCCLCLYVMCGLCVCVRAHTRMFGYVCGV